MNARRTAAFQHWLARTESA